MIAQRRTALMLGLFSRVVWMVQGNIAGRAGIYR